MGKLRCASIKTQDDIIPMWMGEESVFEEALKWNLWLAMIYLR
jgi:hypothetical protein